MASPASSGCSAFVPRYLIQVRLHEPYSGLLGEEQLRRVVRHHEILFRSVPINRWERSARDGHVRAYRLAPRHQALAQLGSDVGALGREISSLPGVGTQVVELDRTVLEPLDQLHVTHADRGSGPIARPMVVREVPEERLALRSGPSG